MKSLLRSLFIFLAFATPTFSVLLGTDTATDDSSRTAEIRATLEDIAARLDELQYKAPNVDAIQVAPKITTPLPTIQIDPAPKQRTSAQVQIEKVPARVDSQTVDETSLEPTGIGFYILPFIGIQTTNDLEWSSVGGVFDIEESEGMSAGLRLGYNWRNFFADFQLSYFQNDMKSINIPLDFSGETEGMGVHISVGGHFHFNEYIAGVLGAGIGGLDQDISFQLAGLVVEESDFLFSYQIFAGFELRPIDYLVIGLRYRWMGLEEMEMFSARNHHLAEVAVGYVF
jgi:opacity protein-like surface antigen